MPRNDLIADSLSDRLRLIGWEEVERIPELGACWEWKGARRNSRGGYGLIRIGRQRYAHRVAYEARNGAFDVSLSVLHHCDNPPCVNPDHLYVGTHDDNMRDVKVRGRHWNTNKDSCPHGHEYTQKNTIYLGGKQEGGRRCRKCKNEEANRRRDNDEYRAKRAAYERARRANARKESVGNE